MSKLQAMIQELPPDLHQEVEDFVQFLLEKRVRKPSNELKLDWRGALEHEREHISKCNDGRGEALPGGVDPRRA